MDLRKKKTLRAIEEAFYKIRVQKQLETITVTELCRIAEISKATFYLHYRDIFDLSQKLQDQIIASIVSKIDDPLSILTQPAHFMGIFASAVEADSERIHVVFSGSQAGILALRTLAHIKELIFSQMPQLKDRPEVSVFLTYHILGGYYACIENRQCIDYKQVLNILEKIQPSPLTID